MFAGIDRGIVDHEFLEGKPVGVIRIAHPYGDSEKQVSPQVLRCTVKGVGTFYTLFNQHRPGKHQVWVCRTLSCALRGSDAILAHCERRLGVGVGQTTPDGKFTLRTAECLASCGTAPMMQVDKTYHENLTPEKVDEILARLSRD